MALVIFKSRASADIMMIDKHAKPILDLLGKDVKQGIITPEQTASVIEKIEQEIVRTKELEKLKAEEQAKKEAEEAEKAAEEDDEDTDKDDSDEDEKEVIVESTVSFAARSYPLLQMLKAALKKEESVYWGA